MLIGPRYMVEYRKRQEEARQRWVQSEIAALTSPAPTKSRAHLLQIALGLVILLLFALLKG